MSFLLWVHPVIGISTVTLVILAYLAKQRQPPHYLLHYVLGGAAVLLSLDALVLGVTIAASAFAGTVRLPPFILLHLIPAATLAALLWVQGTMGLLMANGRNYEQLWRWHRPLGRFLFVCALLVLASGAYMAVWMLTNGGAPDPTAPADPYYNY